ncbi:MAG: hypothetical protein K9G40_07920 [Crocinitomicaceae bacterium]|nr:hypothetical protein [Crocinitomicaceae bacterium]MCF8434468.1 hypothetical protein [Crocinitomicaceae bacterium]
MKKISLLLAFCLAILTVAQAQIPPQAMNYSAVARNAAGQPIATATIGIQISILKTSTLGAVMYSENHFVNTDSFGLFNLIVGAGAVQSGSMNSIQWSTDNFYLKVGMDINGGTNFLTMGTTQLLSVPYALHAATADSITGVAMDGSETVIIAGSDVTITGSGTTADPYIVNAAGATPGTIPTLTTGAVQETIELFGSSSSLYLKVAHTVSSDGGETIVSRGICYSTSPNPTTSGNVSPSGFNNWVGSDTSFMYIIQPNTTYYIRAFAVNSKGTAYGNEVSFTTTNVQLATLVTDPVSNFSFNPDGSVNTDLNSQLINDGGQPPVLGFCYATSPNPTLNDFVISTYTSLSTSLLNLAPNTTYYVRAYGTNIAGTAYGNQVMFTTPQVQLATVETYPVTDIYVSQPLSSNTYFTCLSGAITNNGGTSFTSFGYCYSTNPNPTTADILVVPNANNSNCLTTYLELQPGLTFYLRAYATNAAGTAYGNEVVFSTPGITIPELVTNPVTNIQSTSATLNGEIINWGDDPWFGMGGYNGGEFVVSTNPNPTTNDMVFYSNIGNGYEGVHSVDVFGLMPGTTYYVRCHSANSAGEVYGNEVSFTTLP